MGMAVAHLYRHIAQAMPKREVMLRLDMGRRNLQGFLLVTANIQPMVGSAAPAALMSSP